MRTAEEHSFLYLYSGEIEINEHGKITTLHKGDCAFLRKGDRVSMVKQPQNGEQFGLIVLNFPRKFLLEFYHKLHKKKLPEDAKRQKISVYKLPADRPDIRSLFESMTPYFDSPIQPTDELLKLKMTEGIYCLLNTDKYFYTALFDFSAPWKIDILDYMNENYMYNFSIEEMAAYTGRSLASFKRDFKKISPLSPEKWVIEKRLKMAHFKICNEGMKVSDACFEVGFKNLSHFSRIFKQRFGYAPTKL
jgi:AraC-like DNA-binding protein